jgi:hypothetical protein
LACGRRRTGEHWRSSTRTGISTHRQQIPCLMDRRRRAVTSIGRTTLSARHTPANPDACRVRR